MIMIVQLLQLFLITIHRSELDVKFDIILTLPAVTQTVEAHTSVHFANAIATVLAVGP